MKISTKGLAPEEVLAALFNAARPQGMGTLQYKEGHRMYAYEALQHLLAHDYTFDYLEGRVLKVRISPVYGDDIDVTLYDRDNGEGAAGKALDKYRDIKEGRCPVMEVPEKFMGSDRVPCSMFAGINGYRFDNVMGGTLYVWEQPSYMHGGFEAFAEFTDRKVTSRLSMPYARAAGRIDIFKYLTDKLMHSVLGKMMDGSWEETAQESRTD